MASSAVGVAGLRGAGLAVVFGVEGAEWVREEGKGGLGVCGEGGGVGVGCEGGGEEGEEEEEGEGEKHGG